MIAWLPSFRWSRWPSSSTDDPADEVEGWCLVIIWRGRQVEVGLGRARG